MNSHRKFSKFAVLLTLSMFVLFFHISPISAAEYDSFDSMDVHPESDRWTTANDGFTASIDHGRLKCTDTGDGTDDEYTITRDIRDLDGRVKVRFYLETDTSTGQASDRFFIILQESAVTNGVGLDVQTIKDTSTLARIFYYDTAAGYESKSVTIKPDNWYRLYLDYSVPESIIRFRVYFDNGTEVFDHSWYDIGTDYPEFFANNNLELEIQTSVTTNAKTITSYVDYVDAPFDERDWRHTYEDTDSDWLSKETWEFIRIQDDITLPAQYQAWQLNVPNLDRVKGIMAIAPNDADNFDATDYVFVEFRVYCIDANDGDAHIALRFRVEFHKSVVPLKEAVFTIAVDGAVVYTATHTATGDIVAMQFIVGAKDDRSLLTYEVLGKYDTTDEEQYELWVGDVAVSDVATDPSQEFMFEIRYEVDVTGNNLVLDAFIDDWEVVSNGFWAALAVIGIGFALLGLLAIVDAATGGAVGGFFQPLFDMWDGLLYNVGRILQPIIDFLQSFIVDIFEFLFTLAQDVVDFIIEAGFWLWDLGNLPDVLQWVDWGLTGIGQFVDGGISWIQTATVQLQEIWTLGSIIGVVFFFILPLLASSSVGLYLERMFSSMMFDITFGFSPLNIIPRIPAVAVWLVILQLDILDGTAFGGFLSW
jgi:hypothetical protein